MEAGADIVTAMLSGREDIAQCMPREEAELAIIPKDEVWTTLPEFAHFAGRERFLRADDGIPSELRGSGGVVGLPVATVGEEQLLGTFGPQHPRYPFRGMIAVHEFAHSIQNLCFTEEDHEEWIGFYLEARSAGLYPGSHMMTNVGEFFATFTTGYFEVTYELDYGSTRETLKTRFPEVSLALEEIYGEETLPVEYRTRVLQMSNNGYKTKLELAIAGCHLSGSPLHPGQFHRRWDHRQPALPRPGASHPRLPRVAPVSAGCELRSRSGRE